MAKNFTDLSEQEILALAISLEETDARVYADFAAGLKADYPATAQIFHIIGNRLLVMSMPAIVHDLRTERLWEAEKLDRELGDKLVNPPVVEEFVKW